MFVRRPTVDSAASSRASSKGIVKPRRSFREGSASRTRLERPKRAETASLDNTVLTSPIITIVVGPEARLFACHENILKSAPQFAAALQRQSFLESPAAPSYNSGPSHSSTVENRGQRLHLPDEIPEIFSSVLEFLYKGDYTPRLKHHKRQDLYELEADPAPAARGTHAAAANASVYHPTLQTHILKDTLLYCAADRYGLPALQRLALRKQGLRSGIQCAVILASARFAYSNTPDQDARLRAHYLALIIRCRQTFKRSGTMQMEMEAGGRLFFDLFVAMVNHMDDLATITKSPR